jgi:hypothetical protein
MLVSEALLRTQNEAGPGASGGPLHVHPRQEERFIVQEVTLRVRLGPRGSRLVGPGAEARLAADGPAKQQRAHHRDDRGEEGNAEAHHVNGGKDEADDGDDAGRAPNQHELVGAPLAAAPRRRST